LGDLTSAVQFGFICGTLVFAVLSVADRFSPSRVFLVSALAAAGFNLFALWEGNTFVTLLSSRFLTGFCLAGIYPVGMKIAADYFSAGLGKSLGYLVGALVLGTAFPHLLKGIGAQLPWQLIMLLTSGLAVLGGVLIGGFVPDGPHRSKGAKTNLRAFFQVFRYPDFRRAAFGYFGHMWELYTFWAFVPVFLVTYQKLHPVYVINVSLWSFLIIAIGSVSCVLGGYLAQRLGTKKTAAGLLLLSGLCSLALPLCFYVSSLPFFLLFLLVWGMAVIADSPLFSTLVAQNAPPEIKGTALTIVNCIGFAITIVSIQVISWLLGVVDTEWAYALLAVGPVAGLVGLLRS
jgi:MFS family permease